MTAAPAKSERLLNLLIMLLVQRHFVPKDRIRSILYPDAGVEAFEKMFERDKEELRSLGVPIEVGSMDAYFEEPGYRIRRDQFELPEVVFTSEEAAVVALATKVWEHARLADATAEALRKLRATGQELDESALQIAEPRLVAEEPSFDAFWEATLERCAVKFSYRRPGADAAHRHIHPWGVVRFSGRWYVVGWDVDRAEERVFRLSRVQGKVARTGAPQAFTVPIGTDVRAVARRLARPTDELAITVLVRSGAGFGLRRDAEVVERGVLGPDRGQEWDRLVVRRSGDAVAELLSYGSTLVVEGPPEVREELCRRLGLTPAAGVVR